MVRSIAVPVRGAVGLGARAVRLSASTRRGHRPAARNRFFTRGGVGGGSPDFPSLAQRFPKRAGKRSEGKRMGSRGLKALDVRSSAGG